MIDPSDLLYNTMTVREWVAFTRRYNLLWQTVFNGASSFTYRELALDQVDYWIGVTVPAGKRIILWDRGIKLSGGRFTLDVYSGGWSGGTDLLRAPFAPGNNIQPIGSIVRAGVTPDGTEVLREYGYEKVATDQGSKATESALNSDQVVKVFDEGSAMLRITRLPPLEGGLVSPYDLLISYTAWEEDAPA